MYITVDTRRLRRDMPLFGFDSILLLGVYINAVMKLFYVSSTDSRILILPTMIAVEKDSISGTD